MSVKFTGLTFTGPLKLAAAAIALSVASAPAAAQTEIELWLGGEPGTVNVFTELADAYMAENPDVTITSTFIGSDLFNLLGVLGLAAVISPMSVDSSAIGSVWLLSGMVILVVIMMRTGRRLSRTEGALLIGINLVRWIADFTQ